MYIIYIIIYILFIISYIIYIMMYVIIMYTSWEFGAEKYEDINLGGQYGFQLRQVVDKMSFRKE